MEFKRFRKVQGFILDNNGDPYDLLDLSEIEELLNEINEENQKLKDEMEFCKLVTNHRGELNGFANSLIYDFGDDRAIEMWESFKEERWEKFKKARGYE